MTAPGTSPDHRPSRPPGGTVPPYTGLAARRPRHAPVPLPLDPDAVELGGPVFGSADLGPYDDDLTRQHTGEPLGQRITLHGRVTDRRGRPVRGQLVEVWQANAAGRYAHPADRNPAPLDPHFTGAGRCLTDAEGRYRFTTVRPGPYPVPGPGDWWRPAHVHFSLFGTDFTQRLVTQMYFAGDPLLGQDAILAAVPDPAARRRLLAVPDPAEGCAFRWDVVLDGPYATWREGER
ncbi:MULTISPECIES: protocatechuate 3,4-dioxygenase subunit beta [Streptomyces]|uniref:Protocatechuate 3,4-dioxygenase subunit beta n=1 Tax=Streptomyces luteosporeus TaxID=173856 RepID=A0ABN3TN84_9ACTN